jgi:hypothetical protein
MNWNNVNLTTAAAALRKCLLCGRPEGAPTGNVCKDGCGCRYPVNAAAATPLSFYSYGWLNTP